MNKAALDIRKKYTTQFLNTNSENYQDADSVHASIANSLFQNYIQTSDLSESTKIAFALNVDVTKEITSNLIPQISSLEEFFFVSKIVEHGYFKLLVDNKSDKLKTNLSVSKEFGVFYTPMKIAREMAKDAVTGSQSKIIIDPCCGTGNLLAACIEYAANEKATLRKIVGIEIDPLAATVARDSLTRLAKSFNLNTEIEIINANALGLLSQQTELFSAKIPAGTIVINPPYGKLKFDTDKLGNTETNLGFEGLHSSKKKVNAETIKSKALTALNGIDFGKGELEWSKIFLALCYNAIPKNESLVYIGPCGWLNSVSQQSIRKQIIGSKNLSKIHFISETETGFETVNQALAIVKINKEVNDHIVLRNDFRAESLFHYKTLEPLSNYGYAIPRVTSNEITVFIKLQSFKKVREIKSIKNLRGELDQSIDKSIISSKRSSIRVIRGENIGRYRELDLPSEKVFYADLVEFEKRLKIKPKGNAFQRERLVCRQCSYMKQKRRLIFSIIPPNCVVGNSCNYLEVPDNLIKFYLGILNSALIDWYFRVLNGNNHVANYEIDDFPLPEITQDLLTSIENEVLSICKSYLGKDETSSTSQIEEEANLDALVFRAFDISVEDAKTILIKNHSIEYTNEVLRRMKL